MCLGTIARLVETSETGGSRVGRLEDGTVVSLAFLPEAEVGAYVLVHLGVPVEILPPADAAEALALRALDTEGAR
jgi:hydrogenase expression/formation protein HypC